MISISLGYLSTHFLNFLPSFANVCQLYIQSYSSKMKLIRSFFFFNHYYTTFHCKGFDYTISQSLSFVNYKHLQTFRIPKVNKHLLLIFLLVECKCRTKISYHFFFNVHLYFEKSYFVKIRKMGKIRIFLRYSCNVTSSICNIANVCLSSKNPLVLENSSVSIVRECKI